VDGLGLMGTGPGLLAIRAPAPGGAWAAIPSRRSAAPRRRHATSVTAPPSARLRGCPPPSGGGRDGRGRAPRLLRHFQVRPPEPAPGVVAPGPPAAALKPASCTKQAYPYWKGWSLHPACHPNGPVFRFRNVKATASHQSLRKDVGGLPRLASARRHPSARANACTIFGLRALLL
jgi:hypothetical protein